MAFLLKILTYKLKKFLVETVSFLILNRFY